MSRRRWDDFAKEQKPTLRYPRHEPIEHFGAASEAPDLHHGKTGEVLRASTERAISHPSI